MYATKVKNCYTKCSLFCILNQSVEVKNENRSVKVTHYNFSPKDRKWGTTEQLSTKSPSIPVETYSKHRTSVCQPSSRKHTNCIYLAPRRGNGLFQRWMRWRIHLLVEWWPVGRLRNEAWCIVCKKSANRMEHDSDLIAQSSEDLKYLTPSKQVELISMWHHKSKQTRPSIKLATTGKDK